jgi:hypothetical protein
MQKFYGSSSTVAELLACKAVGSREKLREGKNCHKWQNKREEEKESC